MCAMHILCKIGTVCLRVVDPHFIFGRICVRTIRTHMNRFLTEDCADTDAFKNEMWVYHPKKNRSCFAQYVHSTNDLY